MILNEFFNLPQVFEKDMTEDQSQYTDMTVAQRVFKDNPDIDHEDDILNAAFPYVVELVGSRKRANYMFNYDEDFPSDLISAYRYLQRDQHDVGLEEGVAEGSLNEFAPGSGGDDDHQDPYGAPKPEHYDRSIDFFGQFEADHFDDEDMNDATGEFKGYWYYDGKPRQIAYFKFDNPRRTGSNHPGVGWYYEPQNEGVAEGYSLGKVLSLPELLDQIKHILAAKHPGIGWRMTMPAENTFLFSAQNDYNVWSMLVVEPGGDDWVAVGHGMVDPDGKPIIFDRQQLPLTLASASEIADEAIQTYHDIDLSDYADDEDYNRGVAEATGDEKFDTMMGRIQQEPKYPDPQMPPTDVKDLYQWAVKNNKPYHKIFAKWANREGFKSVAPALDKAGTLDSDALDYWTPDVWKIYWGEVRGIDSEMPPEWAKKRIPDELRDYLETVFDAYDHIVFDWPTEYRQIGQQGVAEGIFGSRPNPVLPLVDKIFKVARGLTPQNVETGKQIIQANARDITRMLSPQSKAGVDVIEAKGDYVPPKEADYGPEYQAMVKRVGQKARAQEKARQQPKQPVRESRRALLKQIIQS